MGPLKSKTLPMFHALTRCDTGKRKEICMGSMDVCPMVTDTLLHLRTRPGAVADHTARIIERFIILMYSQTCPLEDIIEARKQLFSQRS